MNKTFTQPFTQSETIDMSIFVQTHDGSFVLAKVAASYSHSPEAYTPVRIEVPKGDDPNLHAIKSLYNLGLAPTHLRQLTSEDEVSYSFVDDTPGSVKTQTVYFVQADLIEPHDTLLYTSVDNLEDYVSDSSFFTDIEYAGLSLLLSQL